MQNKIKTYNIKVYWQKRKTALLMCTWLEWPGNMTHRW